MNKPINKKVVVGMSGGVDSSVAAYLLKSQGYDVIGLFMKNWDEEDEAGNCSAAEDFQDVISVCQKLDIPYYSVNFAKEYRDEVFAEFLEDYKKGYTPNPDILCNREIKFKHLLNKALSLGADYLATGHYCQKLTPDSRPELHRGLDPNKDQSYFLYTIKEEILKKVLFPIGHLEKSQVRQIAQEQGLATAQKKDSTGICFIGKRKFKPFLSRYLAIQKGPIKTPEGKVLGEHDGIAYYTIGQRKGLQIGGQKEGNGEPYFVLDKDPQTNTLIVVQGEEDPRLYQKELLATDISWVGQAPTAPLSCTAKVRYRSEDVPCTITTLSPTELQVHFDSPQKAITPRQSIVFYQENQCLGGAIISPTHLKSNP